VELSWVTKLRIGAALALGAVGLGLCAWPVVASKDPMGVVSAANVATPEAVFLVGLSFLVGVGGYFVAWPYGRPIGFLTVPAGLAVWAIRSHEICSLMQRAPSGLQRAGIYASLRWDSLFWLALIGSGLAGVWVASRLRPAQSGTFHNPLQDTRSKANLLLDAAVALVMSLAIGYVVVAILAQGTQLAGRDIATQPAPAQIVFAVMVAFGTAGFVTGKISRLGPCWPTVASAVLPMAAGLFYARADALEDLASAYPATCFKTSVMAILPVQMVAFGALGAAAGYWLAVRYECGHPRKPG